MFHVRGNSRHELEIFEIEPVVATESLKVDAEMAIEGHNCTYAMVIEDRYAEKIHVVFPKAEEDLIDFLNICKISGSPNMLYPRCNTVFDKEAAKKVEGFRPQSKRKGKWVNKRPKFDFNKSDLTQKASTPNKFSKKNQGKTFIPPSKSPIEQWVFSSGKKPNYVSPLSKWVKRTIGANNQSKTPESKRNEASDSKKFSDNNNYKGKNLMTKTQWGRFQRQKKADALKDVTYTGEGKNKEAATIEMMRKPAIERIFPPLPIIKKNLPLEDEELTSNFTQSKASFNVICVVSILQIEYDVTSEITEAEEDFTKEMVVYKAMCYYVMNCGCVKDQQAMFKRPDHHMQSHLKSLFIQLKINNIGVNKMFVDSGTAVNLTCCQSASLT